MDSLQGQVLIASPHLVDPHSYHTVVLIIQHGEEGALGLVLNRPTSASIEEAWEQVSTDPCPRSDCLGVGGPCNNVLMVLHSLAEFSQVEVLPGLHFTSDGQSIKRLMERPEIPARFFVGCAQWSPKQLESEIQAGAWLTAPSSAKMVFEPEEDQWKRLRAAASRSALALQINPKLIPEDPSVN